MHFDECEEGGYRIFVGALDAPHGKGFIAAVVVSRREPDASPQALHVDRPGATALRASTSRAHEVWRDDSLACGYRWPTPEAALHYAKNRAREMVRNASPMLGSSPP